MAVETLKSTAITNLDASPIVANTAGFGAPAIPHCVDAFLTVPASANTTSTFKLVRIPSKAIVKHLFFESQAQGAGKLDLSVYYSDSTTDGTAAANQGVIVPTTGSQFFASIIDCAAAVASADVINESGNYPVNKRQKQFWDALGLTSDPGGFFDIVAVCATTAITTGTGNIYVDCWYVY